MVTIDAGHIGFRPRVVGLGEAGSPWSLSGKHGGQPFDLDIVIYDATGFLLSNEIGTCIPCFRGVSCPGLTFELPCCCEDCVSWRHVPLFGCEEIDSELRTGWDM